MSIQSWIYTTHKKNQKTFTKLLTNKKNKCIIKKIKKEVEKNVRKFNIVYI